MHPTDAIKPAFLVIAPDGQRMSMERRRGGAMHRPYSRSDGRTPGQPPSAGERRRRRRPPLDRTLGQRLDIES